MSERCGWCLFVAICLSIVAALTFFFSGEKKIEWYETAPAWSEVTPDGSKVESYLRNDVKLYELYMTNSLPDVTIKDYIKSVEARFTSKKDYPAKMEERVLERGAPHKSWMVFAGGAGFFIALLTAFSICDSKLYQSIVGYWNTKSDLKRQITKQQLKTLEDLTKLQERISGECS